MIAVAFIFLVIFVIVICNVVWHFVDKDRKKEEEKKPYKKFP